MEAEVATIVMEDSKEGINSQEEHLREVVKTSENIRTSPNESSTSPLLDSINMIETKAECANKSGASPKSIAENKMATTNPQSDAASLVAVVPSDCQYFFEDSVFRIDRKGRVKFGYIMETSSEEYCSLDKGNVEVAWYPKGESTIESESTIGLADRTLMPADVVKRFVPGKETQYGYCRDINMRVDVRVLGTKYVIKNVSTERLRCSTEWGHESTVCLDSWVGSIKSIEKTAVLRATNGCRIEIASKDFTLPDAIFAGDVVVGVLPPTKNITILTPEIPLITNRKGKRLRRKFTIESVVTDSVLVHWQCKASSDETNFLSSTLQPDQRVSGEDLKRLKLLNIFEPFMLQLKDRNVLKFSSCDTIMKKSDWDIEQSLKFKLILQQQKENSQQIFLTPSPTGPVVGRGDSVDSGNNWHHHHDKRKKNDSLDLDDKSANKLEKNSHKSDNLSNANKDKTLEDVSNRDQPEKNDDNEWISTDNEQDDEDEDVISTTTTISTCTSPSPRNSPNHLSKSQLKKKARKNRKKFIICTLKKEFCPKEGDELVTKAMLVRTTATVVWQDGTVESDIPSTQLYPVYHLDNHEFFPGDFVISGTEDSGDSYRDYGVIQTVDHAGRIAHVKWFTTYTTLDETKPIYKGASEKSVYDLKAHPDFKYRPGTVVIRIANFVGEDAHCTAGQIIDSYIDGRVKVWWIGGLISMCWPQNLFDVGQCGHDCYESEDSWEMESESNELAGGSSSSLRLSTSESHTLSSIDIARASIVRLAKIFNICSNAPTPETMRKLFLLYKACCCIDSVLNTNFFNEDHFMGLIERVRRGGSENLPDGMPPQISRLFNEGVQTTNSASPKRQHYQYSAIVTVNSSSQKPPPHQPNQQLQNLVGSSRKSSRSDHITNPRCQLTTTSSNSKKRCSMVAVAREPPRKKCKDVQTNEKTSRESNCDNIPADATANVVVPQFENMLYKALKLRLLNSAMLNREKAFEKIKMFINDSAICAANNISTAQDDSGNYFRNENCDGSSTSCTSSPDLANIDTNNSTAKTTDNLKSVSGSSIELSEDAAPELVCFRLYFLLKEQFVKCMEEIRERYYKENPHNLSDVVDVEKPNIEYAEPSEENIIEYTDPIKLGECTENANEVGLPAKCLITKKSNVATSVEGSTLTAAPVLRILSGNTECFQILPTAPNTHRFHLTIFHPNNTQQYYKAVQKEYRMLKSSLPPGVWVRAFEDRMDLLSVMIEGPKKTPYEDGMFMFDMQLGREYPKSPPSCHYISYCSDRLNPNLNEDGKVCVSLLGTWNGTDTEVWGHKSSLLQVIVSIQGLILVPEPYFNEAGYEKQKDTQQGRENSRMYNEMVIIKMVQSTTKLIQNPPTIFLNEILSHFKQNGLAMYERIKGWMELSKENHKNYLEGEKNSDDCVSSLNNQYAVPEFPLVPVSRGFCLTLAGLLEKFKKKLFSLENMTAATPNTSEYDTYWEIVQTLLFTEVTVHYSQYGTIQTFDVHSFFLSHMVLDLFQLNLNGIYKVTVDNNEASPTDTLSLRKPFSGRCLFSNIR